VLLGTTYITYIVYYLQFFYLRNSPYTSVLASLNTLYEEKAMEIAELEQN